MTTPDRAALLNDRLDWNLLRTFLVIAREQSVSRAAARLHITQPAVSHALRRLEEQLGRKLVQRNGPRIEITPAGEEVRELAEEIYGSISRLADDQRDPLAAVRLDITGHVRLITVSGVAFPLYDEFLAQFHRRYPGIDFDVQVLRSADIVSALLQRTATAALALTRHTGKRIEHQVFMPERYALYCGKHHPLFGRSGLTTADLLNENFVSFAADQIGDSLSALTWFRDKHGFAGRVVATSASVNEVRRLIYAGFGIGCLPEHVARDEVERGRMMRLPPDEGVADVDVLLLWVGDQKFRAAEQVFLDETREFAREYLGRL